MTFTFATWLLIAIPMPLVIVASALNYWINRQSFKAGEK